MERANMTTTDRLKAEFREKFRPDNCGDDHCLTNSLGSLESFIFGKVVETVRAEAEENKCKCNCANRPHLLECYLNHCPHNEAFWLDFQGNHPAHCSMCGHNVAPTPPQETLVELLREYSCHRVTCRDVNAEGDCDCGYEVLVQPLLDTPH